jgi:hypothetical protein
MLTSLEIFQWFTVLDDLPQDLKLEAVFYAISRLFHSLFLAGKSIKKGSIREVFTNNKLG